MSISPCKNWVQTFILLIYTVYALNTLRWYIIKFCSFIFYGNMTLIYFSHNHQSSLSLSSSPRPLCCSAESITSRISFLGGASNSVFSTPTSDSIHSSSTTQSGESDQGRVIQRAREKKRESDQGRDIQKERARESDQGRDVEGERERERQRDGLFFTQRKNNLSSLSLIDRQRNQNSKWDSMNPVGVPR